MVPVPTIAQHLLCLSAIHVVIPWLLWDPARPDTCNRTVAMLQLLLYTNYVHARSEVLAVVLLRIQPSRMCLCPRLLTLQNEGATFLQTIWNPSPNNMVPHHRRPGSWTYIYGYADPLHGVPTVVIPSRPKRHCTEQITCSSLCAPLGTDTTQTNNCLKIQVFCFWHSVTPLNTWLFSNSIKRISNLTTVSSCAWTAWFITHH